MIIILFLVIQRIRFIECLLCGYFSDLVFTLSSPERARRSSARLLSPVPWCVPFFDEFVLHFDHVQSMARVFFDSVTISDAGTTTNS